MSLAKAINYERNGYRVLFIKQCEGENIDFSEVKVIDFIRFKVKYKVLRLGYYFRKTKKNHIILDLIYLRNS